MIRELFCVLSFRSVKNNSTPYLHQVWDIQDLNDDTYFVDFNFLFNIEYTPSILQICHKTKKCADY